MSEEDPDVAYLRSRGYDMGDSGGNNGRPGAAIGVLLALVIGAVLWMVLTNNRQSIYEPAYIGACTYGPGWRECGRG